MGKHKHSKDKMHVTYTQMKEDWEGKKEIKKIPFSKLPFYCCALSLLPFQNPVCTKEGIVYDMYYIMPFIKKYHRCPITGGPLKATDLIKMNWTKNQKDEFQDPISYKIFTQYTHIVCIKSSGYVYAYDTVQQLNKKAKFYFDLVTNQPFTIQDIITIQNPKDSKYREVAEFNYIKNNIPFVPPQKLQPQIKQNESISRVFQQMNGKRKEREDIQKQQFQRKKLVKKNLETRQDVKGFVQWCIENKVYKHQRQTDFGSASLTSTNFTPSSKGVMSFRQLKQSQIRQKIYLQIKKKKMKGLVQIITNIGNFNICIHSDLVPKTSENFIQLCQSGYYNNTIFHRLVKDFCLQGGDPTGTGTGGQSIFGKAFEDQFCQNLKHKIGSLSMANSGPCSNRSQFFICLSQQPTLDQKHSVFGQIISGNHLLYQINKNFTSKSNKPKNEIIIQKAYCYDNPFRKIIKKLKDQYQKKVQTKDQKDKRQKMRWIQQQKESFKLPQKVNIQSITDKKSEKEIDKKGVLANSLLNGYY